LLSNFSEKELSRLAHEISQVIALVTANPQSFPEIEQKPGIRKVVVMTFNSMYYRITGESIEILSFFSNQQSPDKLVLSNALLKQKVPDLSMSILVK
jgi:hypothetical protein